MKHRTSLALAFLAVIGTGYACVESSNELISTGAATAGTGPATTGGDDGFNRQAMLQHLAETVIRPETQAFAEATKTLENATVAYRSSLSAADLDAARDAWRNAMNAWQRLEMMQIGPAGASDSVLGGADLRDEIYSWPLINKCRVDQELVEGAYQNEGTFASEAVNVRGLDALEYLLFQEGTQNACAPQNDINAQGTWSTIVAEVDQRRADYAAAVASILDGHATQLRNAWEGSFLPAYVGAGSDTSVYPSQRDALNATSDALFYLEKQTKDAKLGVPLAIIDCGAAGCPDTPESKVALHSKQQIQQNIAGFRALFTGGVGEDALGFDDWLRAAGAEDVADAMLADLGSAEAALLAIDEPTLTEALAEDPASVTALFDALSELAVHLKTDFVTVLDLELPAAVEGDND